MMEINPLSTSASSSIQTFIDNKTKPVASLGKLETLAKQLALIQYQRQGTSDLNLALLPKLSLAKPSVLIFAGDHGINEENVSIAPSAVTRQMVLNFLQGGAAINCFCQVSNLKLAVIDCGIITPITESEAMLSKAEVEFIAQRIAAGTNNFSKQAAMSIAQVEQCLAYGKAIALRQIEQGSELLLLGEMGIGNTSSAAAIMSALTGLTVDVCVGRGTGITDEQLSKKTSLIEQAIARIDIDLQQQPSAQVIYRIVSELGGFEIMQMVGAILASASRQVAVVIDGFIVSVAALIAQKLDKHVTDYLVFSHVSQEKAHALLLEHIVGKGRDVALLDLQLRLGEGTGAVLCYQLLLAAIAFYNDMASFDSAGVTV
ncbi:nicotinate-nucleotide--dimethylbenzimidazole phosphoribosyltransferase [Litorilituus sediminis]|uniref:Nicotinate-nucleotide--dimethylbenzimidazole phosphoribosyltransferase n=1 Tax=Litorilituus sediminis TaxID=718192 RepID=A0A4P6P6S5_9GAMM|nr:nicotinate-nucleotide--dimethylbenzimidazole phosphoribosyltransferase [Litorilituus sediminis]QBG35157.1 nicotinate-nucleotide--dimethylbenzimidazole phosphoribosyltransferase [Litorilituus sediminis]